MNFADRLSIEYMMNKGLYAKYQAAKKENKQNVFAQKKQKFRKEILDIVKQLLENADKQEKEENNDDENNEDNDDANNNTDDDDELTLQPNVIHSFDTFVQNCIDNIEDFQHEKKRRQKDENCTPFFTEEEDEQSSSSSSSSNSEKNDSDDNDDENET